MANGYLSELFISFQGEGLHVGRRQLFLRLSGCNLRCRYCDTPDSLERSGSFVVRWPGAVPSEAPNPLSAAEARRYLLKLLDAQPGVDGMAITGGEPLLQAEFIAELLADARLPHPRLLETNGMLAERLPVVLPVFDIVSMDIKLPSNTGEASFWDQHERFLSLARGKCYVKILVDASTNPAEIERAAVLVQSTAPEAPVFLQPITSPEHALDVAASDLDACFALVRRHLNDVRVVPQTHKMLGVH